MAERRTRVLTDLDIQAIRDAFASEHPCTTFSDEEVASVKAIITLFTPDNVQAASELLSGFKDTKKSLWKAIKSLFVLIFLFLVWLAWRYGFLVPKIDAVTKVVK